MTAFISLMLLALWMPVSSHALLDGLDLINDHDHRHAHPAAPAHDESSGGHDAADGNFRAPRNDETAPAAHIPTPAPCFAVALVDARLNVNEIGCSSSAMPWPSTAPPELARTWQFLLRAAPPVRAPSLAC